MSKSFDASASSCSRSIGDKPACPVLTGADVPETIDKETITVRWTVKTAVNKCGKTTDVLYTVTYAPEV